MKLNLKAKLVHEILIQIKSKTYAHVYGLISKQLSNQIRYNFVNIVNDYVCSPIDDVVLREFSRPINLHIDLYATKVFNSRETC